MPPGSVTASFLLARLDCGERSTQGLERKMEEGCGWEDRGSDPESKIYEPSEMPDWVTFDACFVEKGSPPAVPVSLPSKHLVLRRSNSPLRQNANGRGVGVGIHHLWNLTPQLTHHMYPPQRAPQSQVVLHNSLKQGALTSDTEVFSSACIPI